MNAVQEIKWWKAARPKDMGQFGETVCIHIDCNKIEVPAGASVLNAATNAGIYIPALCAHPDLPPAMQRGAGGAGCNLCMIELEGEPGMRKACSTTVADGMRVTTKSEKIFKSRQESLAKTLGRATAARTAPAVTTLVQAGRDVEVGWSIAALHRPGPPPVEARHG